MTKRFPDLLFPDRWAIELKLARPFGDNGREAEHWSQNLLHPYPGNTSSIADAMKLMKYTGPEQPVVVVIGYEHQPARISLEPLIASFEALCRRVLDIQLGPRHDRTIEPLIHPIHQAAKMWCWSVARAR